jgi:hypothetical protein
MNSEIPILLYQFPKPKKKIVYHYHLAETQNPLVVVVASASDRTIGI